MSIFHFFDRYGDEFIDVFVLRAGDLCIDNSAGVRPRLILGIKNARQSLVGASLVVENPAFGCANVKCSFRPINNSATILFLSETSYASEQENDANDWERFHKYRRRLRERLHDTRLRNLGVRCQSVA